MSDLISKQVLELWNRYKPTIAVDAIEYDSELKKLFGTNLASLGTDCISRQEAIDIAKDLTITVKGYEMHNQAVMNYCADIMQLPPIQPAEPQIIRCKDCKNWDTTWTNDFSPNYHYCPMVDGVRKEDWFCADAERRTE